MRRNCQDDACVALDDDGVETLCYCSAENGFRLSGV